MVIILELEFHIIMHEAEIRFLLLPKFTLQKKF